jgi:hypothetical protein
MKITESQLRNVIKQELKKAVNEMAGPLSPEQKAKRAATRADRKKQEEEFVARMSDYDNKRNAVPPEERTYSKYGKVDATPQEYDSDLYGGGGNIFKDKDGKYYKYAVVPATAEEYESALASGDAGRTVSRNK